MPAAAHRCSPLVLALVAATGLAPAAARAGQPPPMARTQPRPAVTLTRERLDQVLGARPRADSSGVRVVRPAGVSDLPAAASAVRLAPGEFVFRKMGDTARRVGVAAARPGDAPAPAGRPGDASAPPQVAGAVTYAMPYRWLTVDSAGVERLLAPYFVLVGGGLAYDVRSRSYRGVALVGVEDTLNPGAGTVPLARPLRLQLATTAGGAVTPLQLAIGHTGLDYDSVRIDAPDPTAVRIRTGADPAGIVIPIPVLAFPVTLTPHTARLEGFGLATTDISVSLPRGLARTDSAVVELRATSARVRPGIVQVAGAAPGVVRLRSGLPGTDTIRAFVDGVPAGETVVTFAAPWTFLGATAVGVLLGGLFRFVTAKRRKPVRRLPWDVAKGAPAGVVAAAAGAIGLDLLALRIDDPGTAVAVLLTAAIGAVAGGRLLDRVAGPAPAR